MVSWLTCEVAQCDGFNGCAELSAVHVDIAGCMCVYGQWLLLQQVLSNEFND